MNEEEKIGRVSIQELRSALEYATELFDYNDATKHNHSRNIEDKKRDLQSQEGRPNNNELIKVIKERIKEFESLKTIASKRADEWRETVDQLKHKIKYTITKIAYNS